MRKESVIWLIRFGFSVLVSDVFGWTEQGKAFLYLDIGVILISILVMILIGLVKLIVKRDTEPIERAINFVLLGIGAVSVSMLFCWSATQIWAVDFYVAYQIITLGGCVELELDTFHEKMLK